MLMVVHTVRRILSSMGWKVSSMEDSRTFPRRRVRPHLNLPFTSL
jgi:hypothetical protein